jgi:hypothetical protein
MKQLLRVAGYVEFGESEIKDIVFNYFKGNEDMLFKVVDNYLVKEHGISAKKLSQGIDSKGKVYVKVDVQSINPNGDGDLTNPIFLKPIKRTFIKANKGFYKELEKYFLSLKKKKKKEVSFDDALKSMSSILPRLTSRKFYLYISDKRQQLKKGFKFDSASRTIRF